MIPCDFESCLSNNTNNTQMDSCKRRSVNGIIDIACPEVVSKYNSEQPEKPGMVKCTCCSSHVQGKTIKWFNDTEAAPEWEQCERCQKWLSHMEQDSKVELLNMCTDCFAEKQGSEKSLDFSSKSRRQTN